MSKVLELPRNPLYTDLIFSNNGRGTPGQERAAIDALRDHATPKTLLGLVEFTKTEKSYLERCFPEKAGWQIIGHTQELFVVGPQLRIIGKPKSTNIFPGLERYAPNMDLLTLQVVLADRPKAIPFTAGVSHFPADFGPKGGKFNKLYLQYQESGWAEVSRQVVGKRPAVMLGDWNVEGRYKLPVAARGQVELFRRGYDAGLAYPSRRWGLSKKDYERFELGIEPQHVGHKISVKFSENRLTGFTRFDDAA